MRLSQVRVGPRRFAALLLALVGSYLLVVHVFIASGDRPNHPRDLLSLREDGSSNNNINRNFNNNEVIVATLAAEKERGDGVDANAIAAPYDDFDEALAGAPDGAVPANADRPISRPSPSTRRYAWDKL